MPIERTVAVRTSSLTYDASTDRYTYTYNFKTKLEWANTCGKLVMRFKDGSEPRHKVVGADIVAGRVEASNVKQFRPGDEVFGGSGWGAPSMCLF